MRMNHAQMYDRVLACDASYNGRFFLGVLTTGIYCLPSCRARKPKSENVRFFPSCEAARDFGLRPCKKCHPDDFERGADPVLETIETLVEEIRTNPQSFENVRAIVRRSGFGITRVFELFRLHYHTTPADLLLHARIAATKRALLASDAALLDIASAAGFESQSAFHEHFREFNGLTPSAYRKLAITGTESFEIVLPKKYPLANVLRSLGRDPNSVTEKLAGNVYTAAIRPGGDNAHPALLTLHFDDDRVKVKFTPDPRDPSPSLALQVHAHVVALLGLEQDAPAFARLARKLGLKRLVADREGFRLPQTPSFFDGLIWVILGQQINLTFACALRRRLTELAGEAVALPDGTTLHALPTPAAVAALKAEQLLPLQFSRQKADYLLTAARLVMSKELDIEKLHTMSATRAERTLLGVRGLGPWSVNYLMMRALGFADCVPYGDTGVTSGLQALLKLDIRPNVDATRRLMAVFSPHRSLATAHLWQLLQPKLPNRKKTNS